MLNTENNPVFGAFFVAESLIICSNNCVGGNEPDDATRKELQMKLFNIEYAPENSSQTTKLDEVIRYENVQIVGKFGNWNDDRSSNVGFQIKNEDGEYRRMRYDGLVSIKMAWANCGGALRAPFQPNQR